MATQRSNVVCWDQQSGTALSPAISWQDRRAQDWMAQFVAQRTQIRDATGLLPNAHFGVSKIHWCLEQVPEVREARNRGNLACGPLASFLLFRLLKDNPFVVDAVNASRTLLWDWQQRNWSKDLLQLFGLTDDYLPQCVANRHAFGELDIADVSIPMTVCTGDQSAALFAGGKPEMGSALINMGTGAFLQGIVEPSDIEEGNPAHANLLHSVVWDDGQKAMQVLEATVNGAGSALQVVANELGLAEEFAQTHYAQWLATKKNIPLYLNGVAGLGSPFWLPQFSSRFVGTSANTAQAAEKMVAVLESIVFLLTLNLEEMRRAGVSLQRIVISGGLSVLDGLCQRLADVSQLPVFRAPQTEATAKGLVYLLAEPRQSWFKDGDVTCFESQENHTLCKRYQQWHKALLGAVKADKQGQAL
jgi:glycerol kinase